MPKLQISAHLQEKVRAADRVPHGQPEALHDANDAHLLLSSNQTPSIGDLPQHTIP